MKSVFIAFLILTALGSSGYAECVYFRVSVKLLQCAPADAKALNARDPYPAAPEDPDLEDPGKEELMQVRCECEYSVRIAVAPHQRRRHVDRIERTQLHGKRAGGA